MDGSHDDKVEQKLSSEGKKVIVNDYSVAHWIAQTYNLDINNMPNLRPSHLNSHPQAFEELKLQLKDYFIQRDKAPNQPELAIMQ